MQFGDPPRRPDDAREPFDEFPEARFVGRGPLFEVRARPWREVPRQIRGVGHGPDEVHQSLVFDFFDRRLGPARGHPNVGMHAVGAAPEHLGGVLANFEAGRGARAGSDRRCFL